MARRRGSGGLRVSADAACEAPRRKPEIALRLRLNDVAPPDRSVTAAPLWTTAVAPRRSSGGAPNLPRGRLRGSSPRADIALRLRLDRERHADRRRDRQRMAWPAATRWGGLAEAAPLRMLFAPDDVANATAHKACKGRRERCPRPTEVDRARPLIQTRGPARRCAFRLDDPPLSTSRAGEPHFPLAVIR